MRRFIGWLEEVTGKARRRRLEAELHRADDEIARLRALLADATRTPTQYARLREREAAIRRLERLRVARVGRAGSTSEELVAATALRRGVDRS